MSFLCGAWWRHLSCDSPTSLTQWPVCSAVSLIFMCQVRRICFCFWTHRFLEGRAGFDTRDRVCQTFPPVLTFLCVWTCLYQRSGSSPTLWSHPIVLDQSWQTCLAQGTNDWSVWKGSGYTTTAVKILNIKLFIFFYFYFFATRHVTSHPDCVNLLLYCTSVIRPNNIRQLYFKYTNTASMWSRSWIAHSEGQIFSRML